MSAHHLFALVAALASLQEPKTDRPVPKPAETAAAPVSLMDLARGDVVLDLGAAERAPERGVAPAPDGPTGKVVDLVLGTQDGQVVCAALAVGKILGGDEKTVLVPTTAFKISVHARRPAIALRLTKAEITALPDFDVKKDGKEGLERAVERARGLGAGGGASGIRAEGERGSKTKAAEASSSPTSAEAPPYVLALSLPECTVSGTDAVFGNVHDAAVDPARSAVGYVIVARSGGAGSGTAMSAIPYRACKWTSHAGKLDLKIAKSSEQLKAAPEYKKPDEGILTPEQMRSADAFFAGAKAGEPEGPRPL